MFFCKIIIITINRKAQIEVNDQFSPVMGEIWIKVTIEIGI